MIETKPQVILGGLDFSTLSDEELWALNLKLSMDLLSIRRVLQGWTDAQILAAHGDPDVDVDDIILVQSKIRLTDIILSRRTGVRVRSMTGGINQRQKAVVTGGRRKNVQTDVVAVEGM